jgi:glucose/mannose-6-phosphate isomerase
MCKYIFILNIDIMLNIAESFPDYAEQALAIDVNIPFHNIDNIVIAAMGGSAISAEILKNFSNIPFSVIHNYNHNLVLTKNTLLIGVSYSGNTEETVTCFRQSTNNCQTLAITSGGKLGRIAKNKILLPTGMLPRTAISYLLFPLAKILLNNRLLDNIDLQESIYTVRCNQKKYMELAPEIAHGIQGYPIVYGYGINGTIARRWRQQMNENAKTMAFNFSLPECNHNEIEAWEGDVTNITCIFLRNHDEPFYVKKRFEFMKSIYRNKAHTIEVFSSGNNPFARAISLLYLGDLVSIHMAHIQDAIPESNRLISRLKQEIHQHSRSSS